MPYKFHIPFRIVNDIGKSKCKKSNKRSIKSSSSQALFNYALPTFSMVALLLLGFTFINPMHYIIADGDAYADENDGISTYATGDTSISMSIQSGAADQKTNAEAGKVAYRTNGIRVTAANVDGYQVFVQASQGSTGTLTNGTTTISGVGNNIAYSNIGDNKWGYALSAGSLSASPTTLNYNTVPESGATASPAYTTDATTETKDFTLAFAAKFASNATAGEYKTNVTLSVAAGAKELTVSNSFYGYTTFNQVTSGICQSIPLGAEGRLQDSRDGKWYWVGRIRNGNTAYGSCWMTQNLDYDGGGNGEDAVELSMIDSFDSSTLSRKGYYDPGEFASKTKNKSSTCEVPFSSNLTRCSYWIAQNQASNANLNFSLTNINDLAPVDYNNFYTTKKYLSVDDQMTCTKNEYTWLGDISADYIPCRVYWIYNSQTSLEYYKHFFAGNYYNQTAASTVCPSGWRLPTQDQIYNMGINAFIEYPTYQGYADASKLINVGTHYAIWTSGTNGSNAITYMYDVSSFTQYSVPKYQGFPIRCVI